MEDRALIEAFLAQFDPDDERVFPAKERQLRWKVIGIGLRYKIECWFFLVLLPLLFPVYSRIPRWVLSIGYLFSSLLVPLVFLCYYLAVICWLGIWVNSQLKLLIVRRLLLKQGSGIRD